MTRFRWVACQLDILAKCSNLSKLRKALHTLPRTLEETYNRILLNVDEELREETLKLLQWLAFSARPLALAEMAEVFAIDGSTPTPRFDPDQRPRDPRDLLDLCSSLVSISDIIPRDSHGDPLDLMPDSVSQSGIISLAHLSVKEYLTSNQAKYSSISYFHLNKKLAETAMSRDCLAYLLQFDTINCLERCTEATVSFGCYAAEFWINHARSEDGSIENNVYPLIRSLLTPKSGHFINWIELFDIDNQFEQSAPAHPLYYASQMGLDNIVGQLLLDCNPNVMGERYGSALASASYGGHETTVRLLLENGANVNMKGGDYGSALTSAAYGGHEAVVRLLLKSGADVNMVDGEYSTALVCASWRGYETIARLLLESGANVNLSGEFGSALECASYEGHAGITQLLLDNGAVVNVANGRYGCALACASLKGHESVIRQLLEHGADVNLVGGYYDSPLASASWGGQEAIVRLLLECGADVNLAKGGYGSALAAAVWHNSHEKPLHRNELTRKNIVQLLLEKGVQVNLKDQHGCTALMHASKNSYEDIVTLLVENGADPGDIESAYPIHWPWY